MKRRAALLSMVVLVLVIVADDSSPVFGEAHEPAAGRYIVVFKDQTADPEAAVTQLYGRLRLAQGRVYRTALKGFVARLSSNRLKALRADPSVAFVEPDLLVYALAQPLPTGVDRIDAEQSATALPVDVDVAIIDTGIDVDHPDLTVVGGRRFSSELPPPFEDANFDDDSVISHGTHVGGIVGAIDNSLGAVGVAPGARLWAVKVLDKNGTGYLSDLIAGVDWVTANAATIEVANMSLGFQGRSDALRTAIQNSVAAGVVYTAAAGNSMSDVFGPDGAFDTNDDFGPSSYPEVAAISALADFDGRRCYGGCQRTEHSVLCTVYCVLCTEYCVLSTECLLTTVLFDSRDLRRRLLRFLQF